MFSIKSSKLKIALTAFAAVLAVAAVVLLINRGKPAVSDNAISLKASNVSYQNRCKTLLDGGRRRVKKFMEFF